jgi:hypothetical protein
VKCTRKQGPACLVGRKYKRPSDSGVTAGSVADLRESIKDILEYPVCYVLLRPPVLQCINGHSLCAKCTAHLSCNPCPICRGKMEGGLSEPCGRDSVSPYLVPVPLQALLAELRAVRPGHSRCLLHVPPLLLPTHHIQARRWLRHALFTDHASL